MVNRVVLGAHYGLRDWLMQRITALVMLVYTLALLLFLSLMPINYENWQTLLHQTWVRVLTQVTLIALLLHAWVGVRDIWMDYVKPTGLRLALYTLTIIWLLSCLIYSVYVVWGG